MRQKFDAFAVFIFTQRLYCHLFPALRDMDEPCRIGETLRGVSDGDICLFDTPRETARQAFAGCSEEMMEEFLQRHIGTLIRSRPGDRPANPGRPEEASLIERRAPRPCRAPRFVRPSRGGLDAA